MRKVDAHREALEKGALVTVARRIPHTPLRTTFQSLQHRLSCAAWTMWLCRYIYKLRVSRQEANIGLIWQNNIIKTVLL